jgi:hypothetical protein
VVELTSVLDEFRIVIETAYHESKIDMQCDIEESLPLVWADRYGLIQRVGRWRLEGTPQESVGHGRWREFRRCQLQKSRNTPLAQIPGDTGEASSPCMEGVSTR